jgi:large subunit ribosomal protein L5
MKNIKTLYTEKAMPGMKADLGIKNPMALPRIGKVVVNVGVGRILKDSKRVDEVVATLEAITGQKAVMTKAKKAIAGFKTREGLEIGAKVTLHGAPMWSFLDRLLHVALPRVRDFQGIPATSVDQSGNANIGIREQIIFPEISPEKVQHLFPFQVTIVTTAKNKQEGESLFKHIGLPIRKEDDSK